MLKLRIEWQPKLKLLLNGYLGKLAGKLLDATKQLITDEEELKDLATAKKVKAILACYKK